MNRNFLPAFPLHQKDLRDNTPLSQHFKFIPSGVRTTSCIHSLKWINCFVGANNSGKSRLIRAVFSAIENAQKNQNQLKTPNINFSNYILINHLITEKGLIKKDINSNWGYRFEELRNSSFYSFENYQTIYTYWNDLRNIDLDINIWFDILNSIAFSLYIYIDNNIYIRLNNPIIQNLAKYYKEKQDCLKGKTQLEQDKDNDKIFKEKLKEINEKLEDISKMYLNAFIEQIKQEINSLINEGVSALNDTKAAIPKLYIPILRGTRPLDDNKMDFYANRTTKDYKINNINIFTGLSIYKELQEHLLGNYQKRQLIREYEAFLSISFFDCQEITLIPHISSDVVHIRIGENEHAIYNLGDGIQALIMLTFPLFLRKNEEWAIFIEEPEAHLHPKWQRFFLDTVKKYFANHQFFFTTHSNVFLSDENVAIYRVWQDNQDKKTAIEYIDTNHSNILEELGYKASDLLNANYILWVEGISDKIYLKAFIKAYDDTLEEGRDYSIMFYGGCSQLEHISLNDSSNADKINILSINPNCGFIVDSDLEEKEILSVNAKEKDIFQNQCKESDKFCWVTSTREIENLISENNWSKAAIQYAKSLPNNHHYKDNEIDVEFIPDNANQIINHKFHDRTHKKKGTLVKLGHDKTVQVRINDKGKIAKEVIRIFPKNKEDLKQVPEIFDNIQKIIERIKKVNDINEDVTA